MLLLGAPPQSVAASQVRGLRMEVSKSALSLRELQYVCLAGCAQDPLIRDFLRENR